MKTPVRLGLAWCCLLVTAWGAETVIPDQPPKVLSQVQPEYPFALRRSGNKGEVTIDFEVTKDGEVTSPAIVKSSHPEFEGPAIEAVLKWKFKPGLKKGQPVNTRMRVPIIFQIDFRDSRKGAGVDPFSFPAKAPKTLPAEFQYDEPPRPVLIGAPVYPLELLEQKITGSATLAFVIDPTGRPRQIVVREATRPEFGASAAAMVAAWKFEPSKKNGQPAWAVVATKQIFDRDSRDTPFTESAQRLFKVLKKDPPVVLSDLAALDSVPKPRFQPAPTIPEAMAAAGLAGRADIEFIIDHTGHAQFPRVLSASREDFGWAAATAVARWLYTVPTKGGKPVDIRTQIPVVVSGKPEAVVPAVPNP